MTEQNRDRLEELLHDAAETYNRPPDARDVPLEAMWDVVASQAFDASVTPLLPNARWLGKQPRQMLWQKQWLRIAAALVLGIGAGRASSLIGRTSTSSTVAIPAPRPVARATDPVLAQQSVIAGRPIDAATSRYLDQAAALFIALPAETNGGQPDDRFLKRASELLISTRLLLDSQASSDPGLRNLLEDLELVLVQVVRLTNERDPSRRTELELIQQALEQRDVLPRLRTAASEHAAD